MISGGTRGTLRDAQMAAAREAWAIASDDATMRDFFEVFIEALERDGFEIAERTP
jgi:hypothetical protein